MKKNRIIPIFLVLTLMSGCSSQTANGVSETTSNSSALSTDASVSEQTDAAISEKCTLSDEEKLQIQDLLTRSKTFFYEYVDCKEICKHKNENGAITTQEIIDNGMYEGQEENKTWYEVADGEVMSLSDLNEKMNQIFTEKMIASLSDTLENFYREENGKLYISDNAGSDGGLLGTDTVYINSVGETDENTFVLYMTAFGAGENWDLDSDITDDFTVTLKKTDSGFKIDECDIPAYQYIEWCYNPDDDMF